MISDAELAQARAWQNELMRDAGAVLRPPADDTPVYDPDLDDMVTPPEVVVYDGPLRVASNATVAPRQTDASGDWVATSSWWVTLPWDADEVLVGDVVQVEESADPWLPGRRLTVASVESSTLVTARRLLCRATH